MFFVKLLILLLTFYNGVIGAKQFRSDYTYYAAIEGWLKIHEVPATWSEARQRCKLEGAVLASPTTAALQAALSAEVNKTSPHCGIHTAVHSQFSKGYFHSIEGIPLSKMALQWLAGEPNNADDNENCIAYVEGRVADVNCSELLPFACYRKSTPDMSIMPCGIVEEYEYVAKTGSCYKFHKKRLTWQGAFKACSAEGGYLAIINSREEATIVKALHEKRFSSRGEEEATYLGFFKWSDDEEWRTVHDETLEQAGYAQWGHAQPDNAPPGQLCGAMFPSGKLDDFWCDRSARFLCEKDPENLQVV